MSLPDHKIVVNQQGEQGIQITEGDYEGVVFTYGEVQLLPVEDKPPHINFTRAVRACPKELRETISEDKVFNQLMGDILVKLLEEEGDKAVELLKEDESTET
jgi:hypothetical protein